MKKIISVLLALMMLLSGFSVFTASAEDSGIADMLYSEESIAAAESALSLFEVKNLPGHISSFQEFKKSEAWSKVSLLGIDLDFLYSEKGALHWSELDVFLKDENGKVVYGTDGFPVMLISKDDISLAFTNVGTYLQRIIYNKYGGLNMYTVENAVGLANIIGKIFFPNFVELDVANFKNYFNNEVPSSNDFYKAAIKLSGLDKIIDANWVVRGKNFCEPVVTALGGNYINFLDDYYTDGLVLGSKLLEGMVKKLIAVGPVDFIYDLINTFGSSAYEFTYRTPVLALFTQKSTVIGSYITESELNTFSGLLQLIFCDASCYSTKLGEEVKFCPLDFPVDRIRATTNKEDTLIYLFYYLNLCGRYKNNNEYFNNMITALRVSDQFSADDKMKLESLIKGFFLGDFKTAIKDAIIPLYKENITTATTSLSERMKNAFMSFLKKIADYFNYLRKIFSGELDYGQGNSPFN